MPGVVSWQDKIVVIGGATKQEIFWSGSNAGTGSADSNFEPMLHRNGFDPAGEFHNVQVATIGAGPTGSLSWSNGINLTTARIDPTCIPLTRGIYAGKILVAGGYGESLMGYRLFTSSVALGYFSVGIAVNNPAVQSVEIGDPDNGWNIRAQMPPVGTTATLLTGYIYDGGWYIKSGTDTEAKAGTNGVLPVTWSTGGRVGMSAIELDDGRVFFTGGWTNLERTMGGAQTGSSLIWDPFINSWEEIFHSGIPDIDTPFGWKPALTKMLDGRIFIISNYVGAFSPTYKTYIFDPTPGLSGSERWSTITTPTELYNDTHTRQCHVMENGNIAVVHAGQWNYIYDQCNLSYKNFSQSLDKRYIGGISAYAGSGTFHIVASDFLGGEGNTPKEVLAKVLYENVVPSAAVPPPAPPDPGAAYQGAQLIGSSRLSSTSPFPNPHHLLASPYGPNGISSTYRADWWKFVPASSSDYYFWVRSGSDTHFPTASLDEGINAFDAMLWAWPWPTGTTPAFNWNATTSEVGQPDWNSTILHLTGGYNSWSIVQMNMTSGSTYYIEISADPITTYFYYNLGVGAVGFSGTVSGTLTHLAATPP